ncbi:MAG: hypothetical protein HKN95_08075, partial [Acidimicrobiia bacterium]|nr:hypothetical protein [Acidimicrobiia bacterium]
SHKWTGLVDTGAKYTLSEVIPGGWSLIEVSCDTDFEWTDNYVEFYLGESDVTCTFTNYQPTDVTTTTTTTAPPELGEIGDFVWEDPTANGIQEAGEEGVPDVQVKLFKGGSLVATTVTDSLGKYQFGGLAAGVYEVQFVLPAGFEFTLAHHGADDAADSDADPLTGKTGGITLVAGEIDHTWDAGVFRPARVLPQVVTTTPEVLPFTGSSDTPGLGGLAAALVALGGMAVLAMKRKEEQPVGGWSRRLPEVH